LKNLLKWVICSERPKKVDIACSAFPEIPPPPL
jgi:hypothetical protein